jgi:hypothetical protein
MRRKAHDFSQESVYLSAQAHSGNLLCTLDDNIKNDLEECVGWAHMTQDRVQWRVLANTAKIEA